MEADGKRFGDFEMDTIIGKGGHRAIVTIIERSTNMLFMRKLDKGKNVKALTKTAVRMLMPYKAYIKTMSYVLLALSTWLSVQVVLLSE